jgi:diadenosine tetraphosphate (Ap4A) HIT family hydrolase
MTGHPEAPCPFCFPTPDRIAFEGRLVRALWDGFPVSPGHMLVVPKRHVPTWFDATQEELIDLVTALDKAKELTASYKPHGYNIGVNAGAAAGQTVFHLHVHLIPRYAGDVPDPRGGVRHIIPSKGRYPTLDPQAEDQDHNKARLVSGGEATRSGATWATS